MISDPQVRERAEVPRGYRGLGRCIRESHSGKAFLFEYYGEELWIPKKTLVKAEGGYWTPMWAIESAQRFSRS